MKKESLISIVFCIAFIVLVVIIYMGKTYLIYGEDIFKGNGCPR